LWLLALCAAYLLPGIIGHDPWKPDEGYIFGSIEEMMRSGDWVVPHVGGEPFMEKPPLFHFVAVLTVSLTSPWLPIHDGARLAAVVFMALTLVGVAAASRLAWGAGHGRTAILLCLSCIGLLDPAHMILPDLPQMAGAALALAGLCAQARDRRWSGLLFGTGVGISFLGKGLLVPGILGMTVIVLMLGFKSWRNAGMLRFLLHALIGSAPWLLIWPTALYLRSPELFGQWFWDNNIGRFLGYSVSYLGAANEPGLFWRSIPWFLFPAWLFAAMALKAVGRDSLRQPAVQIGGVFLLVAALVLSQSASLRTVYLLPLIPAVALIGSRVMSGASPWFDRGLTAFGIVIAVVALIFFWSVWVTLVMEGTAPAWASRLQKWLPLRYPLPVQPWAIAAASLLSLFAVATIATTAGKNGSGLRIWVTALALAWGLLATLWLPWVDAAKSYRQVFQSLAAAMPRQDACVASRSLGESERAMLDYFIGRQTRREEVADIRACSALLVQSRGGLVAAPGEPWTLAWSGARPGETQESFQFYVRPLSPATNLLPAEIRR
jgi:4-amino-4-deoxy-L-arabinose transferase-like glycosyltransferase